MIQLRSYQVDAVEAARKLMRDGCRSLIICAPTGSGKTALAASMLHTAASKGMRSWFNCHRRELIKQSITAFRLEGLQTGTVAAGFRSNFRALVQITSIQTLAKRFKDLHEPRLMVWDECHHIAAGSWAKIRAAFPNAYHIGLTATPQRLDGKGLRKWFDQIVMGPSVKWLIENNFLAKFRLYAPPGQIKTDNIEIQLGDFNRAQLEEAANKPTITGDAIQHYLRYGAGKRAVVFCTSIQHSLKVVEQFKAAGIPAAHVDGETDAYERDEAVEKFRRGETRVLSNVELFGEGFDLPAIEVAILLRPTKSLGLYLQQCGRALRPYPGKREAIILDHAGNCKEHGLPDEEREWDLDGRKKKGGGKTGMPTRTCPECFAVQSAANTVCPYCGCAFEGKPRTVAYVEGELQEVNRKEFEEQRERQVKEQQARDRRREQAKAQTLEELEAVAAARGYKKGWAKYIFEARQRKAGVI